MSDQRPEAGQIPADLQSRFLALLPTLNRQAHFACAGLDNWHDREDLVQDALTTAWALYLRLRDEGKQPGKCPTAFARLAVQCAKRWVLEERPNGRCLIGKHRRNGELEVNSKPNSGNGRVPEKKKGPLAYP